MVWGLIALMRSPSTVEGPTPSPTPNTEVQAKQGKYLTYSYTSLYKADDKRYAATFSPFLPRNDDVVVGMMKQLVNDTYGSGKLTAAAPQISQREGQSYIALQGTDGIYYFLLIKDDTGEVNSMAYFKE